MRKILIILFVVIVVFGDSESNRPEVHADIAIQYENYSGDDDSLFGYIVPQNQFVVRHAAFAIEGTLKDKIEYILEAGSSTCSGGGNQILLMEAVVLYKVNDNLKLGFKNGHYKKGIKLEHECIHGLTAEKPKFAKTFSPCHPLGAVVEYAYSEADKPGLSTQFAIVNGTSGKFDEEEGEINLGVNLFTAQRDFELAAFYTDIKRDFDYTGKGQKGYRFGFGARADKYNIHLQSEAYLGQGFYSTIADVSSEDLEMMALYAEGSYNIAIDTDVINKISPYISYHYWDKCKNNDEDNKYSYLNAGITFNIHDTDAKIKLNYEMPLQTPDNTYKEANQLILRFQAGV